MNVKDLMIGDILMAIYDDGEQTFEFPVVIDGLDENETLVDGSCQLSWKPLYEKHNWIEYAEGVNYIPLTKDILEAIGLKWSGTWQAYCYFGEKRKYIMVTYDEDKGFGVHETPIRFKYLHELRHILRVYGLIELSDNLKLAVSPN